MVDPRERRRGDVTRALSRSRSSRSLELWVNVVRGRLDAAQGTDRRAIALPTYPSRQIDIDSRSEWSRRSRTVPVLHALLHQNASDLSASVCSTFSGDEFYLADHLVRGFRVFPGAALLKWRAAAVSAAGRSNVPPHLPVCLKQVVFVRPLVVGACRSEVRLSQSEQEMAY